ncbi:MAG: transglycosylase domain-containing protein [Eubacterium sp.]|nr:transglycosylase domain-containing protein [Eubacterium sp.]
MNFSKQSVKKKQDRLLSRTRRFERRFFVEVLKFLLVVFVMLVLVMAGAGFGMMKGILDDSPDISNISIKPKGFKTIIYDQNNNERNTLSTVNSNRIYVYYDDIPSQVVNAFVAIEDERFWSHNGIDMKGIFRALVKDVMARNFNEGASTITQQLIKNQVFDVGMNETTKIQKIERKVQEQYLAIDLEKIYSKEQIVEAYLNTIYLGQGCNGIEAAANRYFDKSIGDLTLSEMAVIAGITKNPYKYDPVVFPENNSYRREDVLDKMLELDYISQSEYDAAMADNVYDRIQQVKKTNDENFEYNSYYTDDLMRRLCSDFMEMYDMTEEEAYDEIYTGGYSVYSVQDYAIQDIVDEVINDESYYPAGSSVALNYKLTLLDKDGITTYNYDTNTLLTYYRKLTENSKYNNIYPSEDDARSAADTYKEAMLDATGATFLSEEFKTAPQPQASFVILDQKTGYIKAIGGGRGEKKENLGFDRATNAMRQPGSTFKVLAAFLPYIDTEGGLCSCFDDKPYEFANGVPVRNWYGGYRGPNSLRTAIEQSMNIIAVQTITAVTPATAYEYLIDEGFTTIIDKEIGPEGDVYSDIQQATALGGLTYGVTNLEITAAYAGIANMGMYVKPVYYDRVYDHDGNLVIDNRDPNERSHRMCKETTAWQLIDGMKGVVTSGTGTRANMTSGVKCAGKTGTTSNSYDLWFCGMTPYYTSSIWFGYDSNVTINTNNHKVMWRDINDKVALLEEQDTSADWEQPEGLTKATVCKITGLKPIDGCPTCTDWCDEENLPKKMCKGHMNTITICTESHMMATNACPDTVEYTISYDDQGKAEIVGADFEYDESIFRTKCTLHPEVEGGIKITSSAGEGGSISSSVVVEPGSEATFYITPSSGYTISDVVVDGNSVGAVSQFTFTDIQGEHTITASFAGSAPAPEPQPEPQTTEAAPPPEPETTEAPPPPPETTEAPVDQPQ